jgi:hypothetical protein
MKMLYRLILSLFLLLAGRSWGLEFENDKIKVWENQDYTSYIYNSSIINLPPEWKKVWVLKNFKSKSSEKPLRVQSKRSNFVFDCLGETYYTLASFNYSEQDALSKPILQTNSGFNPKEIPVESSEEMKLIFNRVCRGK